MGGVGLVCAVVVVVTLPPSRGFRRTEPSRAARRATMRRLVTDPALLALYGVAAVAMGAFIAVFNTVGVRLRGEPYALGVAAASLVYLAYAPGSLTSTYAGRLADRVGRRPVLPVAFGALAIGLAVTAASPLWIFPVSYTHLPDLLGARYILSMSAGQRRYTEYAVRSTRDPPVRWHLNRLPGTYICQATVLSATGGVSRSPRG